MESLKVGLFSRSHMRSQKNFLYPKYGAYEKALKPMKKHFNLLKK
jgi:hypothetical protein